MKTDGAVKFLIKDEYSISKLRKLVSLAKKAIKKEIDDNIPKELRNKIKITIRDGLYDYGKYYKIYWCVNG